MTILTDLAKFLFSDDTDGDNIAGELLRKTAFISERKGDVGCYSTFKVSNDLQKVDPGSDLGRLILWNTYLADTDPTELELDKNPQDLVDEFITDYPDVVSNLYSSGDVHMSYFWGGDGFLFFAIPEKNKYYANNDCKKNYNWFSGKWRNK